MVSSQSGHNRTAAYSGQRTFKRLLNSETCRIANSYSSAKAVGSLLKVNGRF